MGIITSPMFPHSYFSSIKCIWRITVATGYYVTLKFQKFDVNGIHDKCSVDSLKIHEGFTGNSPLLGIVLSNFLQSFSFPPKGKITWVG